MSRVVAVGRNPIGIDPRTVGGLLGWWRAANVLLDGSNNVQTIFDLSGNNHHATQSNPAYRNAWTLNGPVFGGRPYIKNAVGNTNNLGTTASLTPPFTQYLIAAMAPGFASASVLETQTILYRLAFYNAPGNLGVYANNAGVGSTVTFRNAPKVICATIDVAGAANTLYITNPVTPNAAGITTAGSLTGTNLTFMYAGASSGAGSMLAEYLYFSGLHTLAQRTALMGLLAREYSLAKAG